jgi:hypothetical protein
VFAINRVAFAEFAAQMVGLNDNDDASSPISITE